jgi:hypothetical protein
MTKKFFFCVWCEQRTGSNGPFIHWNSVVTDGDEVRVDGATWLVPEIVALSLAFRDLADLVMTLLP